MRHYAHIPGAILFYLIFAYLMGISYPIIGIIIAAGIAMLPDLIDKVSEEHRYIGHSIIWMVPLSLFALSNMLLAAAFLIGFLSHLFLDMFTVNGCPFLYPFKEKSFTCLATKRKIKTGSNQDKVLSILLVMFIVPLVLVTFNLLPSIGNAPGLTYADTGSPNTTETMKSDINMYFNLNEADNKNLTIQKSGNTTTILIKDIEEENKEGL